MVVETCYEVEKTSLSKIKMFREIKITFGGRA